MNNRFLRRLIWILTLLYMSVIFYMSSRPVDISRFDSGRMMMFLRLADSLEDATDLSDAEMMRIHNLLRHGFHVVMYAGLCMLYFVSLYGYFGKIVKTGAISVVLAAVYGALDEVHQIFSNRGAAVSDVILDFSGAVVGVFLIGFIFYCIEKNVKLKAFFCKFYDFNIKRY